MNITEAKVGQRVKWINHGRRGRGVIIRIHPRTGADFFGQYDMAVVRVDGDCQASFGDWRDSESVKFLTEIEPEAQL